MEGKDPWQDVPKYHLAGHKLDPMFFGIYRLLEKMNFIGINLENPKMAIVS